MRKPGKLHTTITPESVELLASVFGGGRRVSVPTSTATADHFAVIIGAEQTARLVEEFGGDRFYLPGRETSTSYKNGKPEGPTTEEVRVLTRNGRSAQEIAQMFGCSTRTVSKHRRRATKRKGRGKVAPTAKTSA